MNGKEYNAKKTANGYANLRVGIVAKAVADYRRALFRGDKYAATTLERWFLSEWGEFLSGGHGAYIIETVRKECKRK